MTFGSLFAGIGGFDLALERAGMECRWQVEKDRFCLRVLEKHWPHVRRFGDVRTVGLAEVERVDLICAGFPCQGFSVAGERRGLEDPRSALFWEVVRFARFLEPRWLLLENVPGLLTSRGGRDFGLVLSSLDDLGYGLAWRVLDSRYLGVPQRRRRLFLVGCFGEPCPPEVLFEPQSGGGHSPQSEKAGKDSAGAITPGIAGCRGRHNEEPQMLVAYDSFNDRPDLLCPTLGQNTGMSTGRAGTIIRLVGTLAASGAGTGRAAGQENESDFLVCEETDSDRVRETSGLSRRLDTSAEQSRSRCQPADGPRYRALGNAVTVNAAEWIGCRIVRVHSPAEQATRICEKSA